MLRGPANRPGESANAPRRRRPSDFSVVATVDHAGVQRRKASSKRLRVGHAGADSAEGEAKVNAKAKDRELRESAARAKAKARAAREASSRQEEVALAEAKARAAREAAERQVQKEETARIEANARAAREAAEQQAQRDEAMRVARAAQLSAMEAESRRLAEAMQALRDGSTDAYLSDVASEMLCLVCHELLKAPVTTVCGHSFCSQCLQQSMQSCGSLCPACRSALPSALPKLNVVLEKLVAPHRGT